MHLANRDGSPISVITKWGFEAAARQLSEYLLPILLLEISTRSRLCSAYPAILRTSLNTLTNRKKVAFIEQHLKLRVVDTLTKVPNLLNYSLPRIAERALFAQVGR